MERQLARHGVAGSRERVASVVTLSGTTEDERLSELTQFPREVERTRACSRSKTSAGPDAIRPAPLGKARNGRAILIGHVEPQPGYARLSSRKRNEFEQLIDFVRNDALWIAFVRARDRPH